MGFYSYSDNVVSFITGLDTLKYVPRIDIPSSFPFCRSMCEYIKAITLAFKFTAHDTKKQNKNDTRVEANILD